jgi:CRP/FNR family cyclic AMP-dependent transcriptional regulator
VRETSQNGSVFVGAMPNSLNGEGHVHCEAPVRTDEKTMLSANKLKNNDGANEPAAPVPADFPISEISGLNKLKLTRFYPRNSVLFIEGQRPQGVHVLRSGRVKVSITSAKGKTLILRIAQPGDLLGINATLTGKPYGATVETLEPCQIDFVSRESLLELLNRDEKACLGMARVLSRKLSGVVAHNRWLFLSQSASEKLARLLVRWCDEGGKPTAHGIRINLGLTHEELAQMICTSRETVTRLLADLKRKQVLSLSDRAIFIRNRAALELAARC